MRLWQPHRTRAPETGCVKTPLTYTNASVQASGKESGSTRGPENETQAFCCRLSFRGTIYFHAGCCPDRNYSCLAVYKGIAYDPHLAMQ